MWKVLLHFSVPCLFSGASVRMWARHGRIHWALSDKVWIDVVEQRGVGGGRRVTSTLFIRSWLWNRKRWNWQKLKSCRAMILKQPQCDGSQFGHEATAVAAERRCPILSLTAASFTLSTLLNIAASDTWIHDKGKGKKSTAGISQSKFQCICGV